MKLHDGLLGLIVAIGGVALAVAASRLPPTPGQAYGSAFFPLILGVVLAGAGLVLLAGALVRRERQALVVAPGWLGDRWAIFNVLVAFGCVAFYVLASERLGFFLCAVAILAVLQLRFGRPIAGTLLWAVVIAASFQTLFASLLRVPLPPGPFLGVF